MKYVLENKKEATRLERQSQSNLYDPLDELEEMKIQKGQRILDAGCGSGLVARLFAESNAQVQVSGIDASEARINEAKQLAKNLPNVHFTAGDIAKPLPTKYDRIICRYVLEHMAVQDQFHVVKNLAGSLDPGGQLWLIDIDGYMHNIYPRTPLMDECLAKIQAIQTVDLFVGRKLAQHLINAELTDVTWRIQTLAVNDPSTLAEETALIRERFEHSLSAMAQALGSEVQAKRFQLQYLETLERPGTSLFYNKFIAVGSKEKAPLKLLKA